MWEYDKITSLNIEASSLCNAECLFCARFEDRGSPNLNPNITLTYIKAEDFKNWLSIEFLSKINHITFSGDYGDPMTNPEIIEILEYIFEANPTMVVNLCTNGGMKNTDFWTKLGNVMKKDSRRTVTFSIDGLEDTNHLYRRKVKWDKVMENVKAYLDTGASALWDFLIFGYNVHQVEEAKKLADELGFTKFYAKNANGMGGEGNLIAKDKEGNTLYEVEPAPTSVTFTERPIVFIGMAEDLNYENMKEQYETRYKDEPGEIKCFSARSGNQEIRISAWGDVHPCCHIGAFTRIGFKSSQILKVQIKHYMDKHELSLHKRPLKEILESKPFQWFEDSWQEKKCAICWNLCGVNEQKKTLMNSIFGEGDYGKS